VPSYVLTGAPGAGKTAILRLLEASGYPVVEEAATDVIALSRYLGFTASRLLDREVRQVIAERTYEPLAFFIRNQGFVQPTPARQISFEDSLAFERLHEQVYRELGFQLINVPAGPLADRVALIKHTISQQRAG
jgi:predicted ATPase